MSNTDKKGSFVITYKCTLSYGRAKKMAASTFCTILLVSKF